jgi:GDP-D-mannose dehydratase
MVSYRHFVLHHSNIADAANLIRIVQDVRPD